MQSGSRGVTHYRARPCCLICASWAFPESAPVKGLSAMCTHEAIPWTRIRLEAELQRRHATRKRYAQTLRADATRRHPIATSRTPAPSPPSRRPRSRSSRPMSTAEMGRGSRDGVRPSERSAERLSREHSPQLGARAKPARPPYESRPFPASSRVPSQEKTPCVPPSSAPHCSSRSRPCSCARRRRWTRHSLPT